MEWRKISSILAGFPQILGTWMVLLPLGFPACGTQARATVKE
jgi:hypothetical protein